MSLSIRAQDRYNSSVVLAIVEVLEPLVAEDNLVGWQVAHGEVSMVMIIVVAIFK